MIHDVIRAAPLKKLLKVPQSCDKLTPNRFHMNAGSIWQTYGSLHGIFFNPLGFMSCRLIQLRQQVPKYLALKSSTPVIWLELLIKKIKNNFNDLQSSVWR